MNENLSITKQRHNNQLNVILKGNLDGNSAWELLNDLKDSCTDIDKVVIQTESLRDQHLFGKRMVLNHLYFLDRPLDVVDADNELHKIIIQFKNNRHCYLKHSIN